MSANGEKPIRTICGFCHTNCGLITYVKDGVITRIKGDPDHPVNGGADCPKGRAGKAIVYSPDRLQYPLRRVKSGFKRISWDEALDTISDKLLRIRDQYGGKTIIRGVGAPITEENRDGFGQIVAMLGSNDYIGVGHICHQPRSIGFRTVFGQMPQPDYENTKLILIWGSNPFVSNRYGEVGIGFACAYGGLSSTFSSARKRGVKVIVIDPWHNHMVRLADKWLQLEPGRDDALALAMLNVIINDELYDRAFVEDWTTGFDELAAHVKPFTPAWAEGVTRLQASDIQEVARLYATTKPALIREGNALDQYPNAVQTTRAIAMLEAITGNLDRKGGNVFFPFPRLTPLIPAPAVKRLSSDAYPMYPSVPFPAFADAVLTGKPYRPRALLVNHSNTLLIQANTNRTRQVLDKLEFLVVCDIFRTATTELADIVLPEASPFERYGYRGYAGPAGGFVALRRKVIEPVGESRTVFEMEYDLAKRMGLAAGFPFRNNKEWISYRLTASHMTFHDLEEKQIIQVTAPMKYEKYLENGFKTPSGRVELYSQRLKDSGYAPLPEYEELDRRIIERPSLRQEYPLIGTTRRSGSYTHTQFRNIPILRKLDKDCLLRIHPEDATIRNISDGDRVRVESPDGKMEVKAILADGVAPGIVLIDFGWGNPGDGGQNVNLLTSDEDRDPISCSTSNHRFRCQVTKH
ncbi:MAG: molybdopterin-dependent oxidoreductase [Deltaproteobacteria bacterium]|nr:molybdopterin-dependent oxidoreductase [Deltaproteobacteria bacterium]